MRRAGRKGHSGPVTVISAPSSAARPRVAFALSRKVGTAVTRNLIRRRLRALMSEAEQQGRLPINDYLIVGAPAITTLSYPQLRDHLAAAVRSANRPRAGVPR